MKNIEQNAKENMEKALEHTLKDFKSLRTGRASPAYIEGVMIDVYGSQMRLKDISSITTPEPRQLLVTPYDPNNAASISKAIESSSLNLQPVLEGHSIRMSIPPMDESVRKNMVKECKKMSEKGKVGIRSIRRECNEDVKKMKSNSELTEDDVKSFEKTIQELTDKYCKQIEDSSVEKEKEIMTI
jgi:ribosome recycling factor